MLFNSWDFAVFFVVVYGTYLLLPTLRAQNILLLLASYYFYAAWDWRFLGLIFLSSGIDYLVALKLDNTQNAGARKLLVCVSLISNLTILGFFKYYNFFVANLENLLTGMGFDAPNWHLNIILPVGLSFYTFQALSYTIDVYRRELKPVKDLLDYSLFVAFFPQLVAGPIMRATALLPQIRQPRTLSIDLVKVSLWLIFWGLWKKVVIADNLAFIADPIFARSASATALQVYIGVLAFAGQLYCDFSGYSDVAIGIAGLMGVRLIRNFDLPYFARNPSDFWRRWHISLSTWLRDYLYIPLGGNRGGEIKRYRNLLITMGLGGLWHGAAWNFVFWGFYHGALLSIHRTLTVGREIRDHGWSWWWPRVVMFHCTLFGWLLFRASRQTSVNGIPQDDSRQQLVELLTSYRNGWGLEHGSLQLFGSIAVFLLPLLVVEAIQYRKNNSEFILGWHWPQQALLVGILLFYWLMWGVKSGQQFIYFQF